MSEHHPGWVTGVDASEARLATGLLLTPDNTPLRSLNGIRPSPGFPGQVAVKAGSSPVAVTVNPFQAVIQDQSLAAGGAYLATLEGVKELPLAAAAAAQDRIDLVVAEIDTTSSAGFVVHVVQGIPGNPPQAPSPANPSYLVLAQVTVYAGGTKQPTVNDRRTLTTTLGGILPVFTAGARQQAPYQGSYVHRLDTNYLEYFDGARWRSAVNTTNSGWIPLALDPRWVPYGPDQFGQPQVRRVGNTVYLRGIVAPTVDFPALSDASPVIGTIPATFAPRYPRISVVAAQPRQASDGQPTGGWIQLTVAATSVQLQYKNPQPAPKGAWVTLETSWLVDDPNESS